MASGDNPCIPVFEPGARITGKASALVRGKRFVVPTTTPPSGGMLGTENFNIAEAGAAAANVIGVAAYEGATGDQVPLINGPGYVIPVVAGAAIVSGDVLKTDASGRVVPQAGTGTIVAVALDSQPTVDADVVVRLAI